MANFTIKTIKNIREDVVNKYNAFRKKYGDETKFKEHGLVSCLIWAFSAVAATLYQYGLWIYKQCFPQTCDLEPLKWWGELADVFYKTGQKAAVKIKLTDVSVSYLSAQTVYIEKETNLLFKTVCQAPLDSDEDGVIYATAECTQIGPVGNIEVGTKLFIANPLRGVPQEAEVVSLVKLGTEDELLEAYRKRVLNGFKKNSSPGSALDYYYWGLEVDGIVDILPYVFEDGLATIFPVAQGSGKNRVPTGFLETNPFPVWINGQIKEFEGSGQMLALAYAIEGSSPEKHDRRPLMASVDLKPSANFVPFSVEIDGLNDTSYCEQIKEVITNILDLKRPHIVAINYDKENSIINKAQLNAACYNLLNGKYFSSFLLKNKDGDIIDEAFLGIGELAYLDKLIINQNVYYDSTPTIPDSEVEDET